MRVRAESQPRVANAYGIVMRPFIRLLKDTFS